ncbi:MAG TPA: phosphoglycerate kinase [Acidobacteriota bacterium]
MHKLSVRDLDLEGRRVFVRVDYNVPLESGRVADDSRIRASLPTLRLGLERGAALILASHLGRPKGKPNPDCSLAPVAGRLAALLERPVSFATDCVGPEVQRQARALRPGEILMLENLRFHAEEEKNDPEFAAALADLAECYVNDAFGAAHRAHASTAGMASHFERPAAGLLMAKELDVLGRVLAAPRLPLVLLLGGAKVKDKIPVLENLVPRAQATLIGGGMAYTFLAAEGIGIGASLLDRDHLDFASELLRRARERGCEILLPRDHVVAPAIEAEQQAQPIDAPAVPAGLAGFDIGPKTVSAFRQRLAQAGTIVWNGPMGVFERPRFAAGTRALAQAVADSPATSIVGGGDSVRALEESGLAGRISHVSTGGGASLELLGGLTLPGVAALADA